MQLSAQEMVNQQKLKEVLQMHQREETAGF